MKEQIKRVQSAQAAEGRICVDYTDPVTGRVLERIEGKNHIFMQSLAVSNLFSYLSNIALCVTDFSGTLRTEIPLVPGNLLGYGIPSQGSSGTLRGAIRTADCTFNDFTRERLLNKFVYDFTPNQLNGAISTVGLTNQFAMVDSNNTNVMPSQFLIPTKYRYFLDQITSSLRYIYRRDTNEFYVFKSATKISKYSMMNLTETEIDISALCPAKENYSSAVSSSSLGYCAATGNFWLVLSWRDRVNNEYHSFMDIVECDSLFSKQISSRRLSIPDAESRYAVGQQYGNSFAVYGDLFYALEYGKIAVYDFLSRTAISTWDEAVTKYERCYNGFETTNPAYCSIAVPFDKYTLFMGSMNTYDGPMDTVFDMAEKRSYAGAAATKYNSSRTFQNYLFPFWIGDSLTLLRSSSNISANALSCYQLPADTPPRPEGSGVTITYEIEVYF